MDIITKSASYTTNVGSRMVDSWFIMGIWIAHDGDQGLIMADLNGRQCEADHQGRAGTNENPPPTSQINPYETGSWPFLEAGHPMFQHEWEQKLAGYSQRCALCHLVDPLFKITPTYSCNL